MANELEIRTKLKQYLTLLAPNGAGKGSEESYADYIVALSALNDKIDAFFTPDNEGNYPKVSGDALNDIIGAYNKVIKQGETLRSKPAVNKGDRFRAEITTAIDDFLCQDLNILSKVNPEDEKSLPALISGARTKTVDLTGQKLEKVGANSSVRLPFTYTDSDGREVSGFFTEKTTLQTKEELFAKDNAAIREKYPDEADFFFTFQKQYEMTGICSTLGKPDDPITDVQRQIARHCIQKNLNVKKNLPVEEANAKAEEFMKDDLFIKHLREYGKMVDSKANDRMIRDTVLKSNPGAVMDSRNSGMSIVANLLGVGDVIAHSEPMKIILDGKEIEGTFMRTAQGKDINNIAADDPLTKISYDQLNQTKPKQQMADLMVLDYICGNLDRHAANIFYQTDAQGNLTGIIGIDNDMSFPSEYFEDPSRSYGLNDSKLDRITAISSEMAEHVMNLTPEILKASLRGVGLSDLELDVAARHLSQIQERIARDIEYYKDKEPGKTEDGHLRIIDDFSKVSLLELALDDATKKGLQEDPNYEISKRIVSFTPMGRMYSLDKYATDSDHPSPEKLAQRKVLPKGSELQIHEEIAEDTYHIGSYKSAVTIMKNGLDLVDPWNVHSSTEFKAMKACLTELNNQLQVLPGEPDSASITRIRNTYSDLARLSQKYIDKKSKEKSPSNTALTRMDMAERINALATMHLANFEKIVEGQVSGLDTSSAKLVGIDFFDGIDTANDIQEPYAASFADLKHSMEPFLTLNADGRYPTLDSEDIDELKVLHEDALKKTEEYLSSHEGDPDFANKSELAYKIQRNLMKDYMALQSAKPGITLHNVLSEANGRTVDVTGHIAKTMGNVLSTRRQLSITGPDGKIVKGFFTEREYIGKAGTDNTVAKLSKAYPQYAEEIRLYGDYCIADRRRADQVKFNNEMLARHNDDPEFAKAFDVFTKKIQEQVSKSSNYSMLYDRTSSPIDTRNTAMSDVANLLGIGDVIAQSTEMKLKDGDKIIEGTFMLNAEGEDFAHLKEDNTFKDCKENWLDNSPALRQMSDLTVLDYLCMNVDRHKKNIFYKFDKSDPANPKLVGITGIDNDMSFAPVDPEMGMLNQCRYNSGLEGLTSISQNLAQTITNLDPAMLKGVLELRGLTKAHVDGACQRLDMLKTAIAEGKIPVLSEEEFLQHKASDFMKKNGASVSNVFTEVDLTRTLVKKEPIKPEKPLKPADIVDLYEKIDNLTVGQDNALLDELKLDLHQATIGVHGGSKEFSSVQESLDMLAKANKIMSSHPDKSSLKNVANLKDAYSGVLSNCVAYLNRKNQQGKYFAPNTKDGRRIQAVRKVIDFCQNRTKSLGEVVKRAELQKSNVKTNNIQKNVQNDIAPNL